MSLQPINQSGPQHVFAAGAEIFDTLVLEVSGVDSVGIDQATEQQAHRQPDLAANDGWQALVVLFYFVDQRSQVGTQVLLTKNFVAAGYQRGIGDRQHLVEVSFLLWFTHAPAKNVLSETGFVRTNAVDQS